MDGEGEVSSSGAGEGVDLRCSESMTDMEQDIDTPRRTAPLPHPQPQSSPKLKQIVLPTVHTVAPEPAHIPVRVIPPAGNPLQHHKYPVVNPLPQLPLRGPTLINASARHASIPIFRTIGMGGGSPVCTVPLTTVSQTKLNPSFVPSAVVRQQTNPVFVPITSISTQPVGPHLHRPPHLIAQVGSRPVPSLVVPKSISGAVPTPVMPSQTQGPYFVQQITKSPSAPPAPSTPNREGTPVTPGQSPRPSILRKRHSEMTKEAACMSPAARKLIYEPTNLSLGSNNEREIKIEREESPTEERRYPHNLSTASTGSTLSANGSAPNSQNEVELSPRKRPRKQAFEEKTGDDAVRYTRITDENATANDQQLKLSMKRVDVNGDAKMTESDAVVWDGRVTVPEPKSRTATPDTIVQEEADEDRTLTPPTDDALSDGEADSILPSCYNQSPSVSPPPLTSQRKFYSKKSETKKSSPTCVKEEPKEAPIFRPRPSMLAGYKLKHYPRKNHFRRPETVRTKTSPKSLLKRQDAHESRKVQNRTTATVKLANDDSTWKKLSDVWKLDRVVMQLDEVAEYEEDNTLAMCSVAKNIASNDKIAASDRELLEEMSLTSAQRNKAMIEIVDEIKGGISKIKHHADNSKQLLGKYATKRQNRAKKNC